MAQLDQSQEPKEKPFLHKAEVTWNPIPIPPAREVYLAGVVFGAGAVSGAIVLAMFAKLLGLVA